MIKPTIGRVIHYYPGAEPALATLPGQPIPALVCGVHSDGVINIAGFDAVGTAFARTSVALVQEVEDSESLPEDGYATWMPYQKEQAAKAETSAAS